MQITRANEAGSYNAAKHFGMTAQRLQGEGASDCEDFWVGLSTFTPGGGAEWSESPTGKVYVVLEGKITVKTETGDVELGPLDSCYLSPGEGRSVENKHNAPTKMLVISQH